MSTIVTINFVLNEEVTPELFAAKVAIACAKNGAIIEGESLFVNANNYGLNGQRYCNKFYHNGFYDSDLGGMLKSKISMPNITSLIS